MLRINFKIANLFDLTHFLTPQFETQKFSFYKINKSTTREKKLFHMPKDFVFSIQERTWITWSKCMKYKRIKIEMHAYLIVRIFYTHVYRRNTQTHTHNETATRLWEFFPHSMNVVYIGRGRFIISWELFSRLFCFVNTY